MLLHSTIYLVFQFRFLSIISFYYHCVSPPKFAFLLLDILLKIADYEPLLFVQSQPRPSFVLP